MHKNNYPLLKKYNRVIGKHFEMDFLTVINSCTINVIK